MLAATVIDLLTALLVLGLLAGISLLITKKMKDSRKLKIASLGLAVVFILFFVFHLLFPWISPMVLWPLMVWKMEYILIAIAGTILVTIRFMQCKNLTQIIVITALGTALIALATIPFTLRPFMHAIWAKRPTILKNGVVMQQSPYSCGAASLATVLRMKGYDTVTERDAVIALHVVPILGTEPDCQPAAVEKLTHGEYTADVRYCRLDGLAEIALPCIAPLKHRGLMGHYVAILGQDGDNIIVGDPLFGVKSVPRETLAAKWKGTIVVLRHQ